MRILSFAIVIIAFLSACQSTDQSATLPAGVHKIVLDDVLQAGSYTYLQAKENGKEIWLAVSAMEAAKGETYYYKGGFEMNEFKSKELKKTFKSILFLDKVFKTPELGEEKAKAVPEQSHGSKVAVEKITTKIEKAAGGITVAELFEKKQSLSGKSVKIKGQVMKFSTEIMKKNWVHLQDGSDFSGKFDLVLTLDTTAVTKVGDIITVEGKVSVDKNFGFGYVYDVMLEDSKIVK